MPKQNMLGRWLKHLAFDRDIVCGKTCELLFIARRDLYMENDIIDFH